MAKEYSFDSFDKFNRKPFAERLTRVLTKFYPFYDEAFVLSLNARFGSGKTTFLKMWKHDLESKHAINVVYRFIKESWVEGSILLIAISIKNPALYQKIGKNLASPKEISDFLYSLNYDRMNDTNAFRYANG